MMDIPDHLRTGRNAENQACDFLIARGLTLLERNYQCKSGEIDLIMHDTQSKEKYVIFIEVRSRNSSEFGNILETVDRRKQGKILRTATHFLLNKDWFNKVNGRFDVVALYRDTRPPRLDWIKNAFTTDAF